MFEQLSESLSAQASHVVRLVTTTPEERRLIEQIRPYTEALRDVNSVQARMFMDIEIR